MTLGEKIRVYRKNNEWSQDQLGEMLHLSGDAVQKYEKDKNMPPTRTLSDIASLFLTTMDDLLDESEEVCDYIFLYEGEFDHGIEMGDSPHMVYDANLEHCAKLHRFTNAEGCPYSAIYQGSYEIWTCDRSREMNMITSWNEHCPL